MEKEEKIISEILEIPLKNWIIPYLGSDTFETEVNEVKIKLYYGYHTKFIKINQVQFVDEKINKLVRDLIEFNDKVAEDKRLDEIDGIYNLLCLKPTKN